MFKRTEARSGMNKSPKTSINLEAMQPVGVTSGPMEFYEMKEAWPSTFASTARCMTRAHI